MEDESVKRAVGYAVHDAVRCDVEDSAERIAGYYAVWGVVGDNMWGAVRDVVDDAVMSALDER